MVRMTEDEWRAALRAAESARPEGLSARELGELLGLGEHATRKQIRKAIAAGELRCAGRRYEPSIDGTPRPIPIYRLAHPGKK